MEEIFSKPFLVILMGNVGTGKTTIGNFVQRNYGGKRFSIDEFKEVNKILSSPDLDRKLRLEIEAELMHHRSVILDGKYLLKKSRSTWIYMANRFGINVIAIDCGCGDDLSLLARLNDNRGISEEIWRKEFETSRSMFESPVMEEGFNVILRREAFCK